LSTPDGTMDWMFAMAEEVGMPVAAATSERQ
jgi:hypothetical protein